jgi:hypothetical protein
VKAVTTSMVDSPASEAISGKSTFQCVGGGTSIVGNGCVPRVRKVVASASRSCARSRAPRSIRSTRSTRSFVRVLRRSGHGNVYARNFSANCCALGIARATAGGMPANSSTSSPVSSSGSTERSHRKKTCAFPGILTSRRASDAPMSACRWRA